MSRQLPDALFSSFMEDVKGSGFDPCLKGDEPWIDARLSAISTQSRNLFHKYEPGELTDSQKSRALLKFCNSNYLCKNWALELRNSHEEEMFGTLKKLLDNFWHPNGFPMICSDRLPFAGGRCGPGASLGATGKSLYHKLYASRLTSTSDELYRSYRASISHYPEWETAELARVSQFGACEITKCSSLSYVPKNIETARVIATEPSLNMFYQLGVGEILNHRLKTEYGIDIPSQQPKNIELARRGSAHGWFSTIDLSSASDSVGIPFLMEVLPKSFLDILKRYRCESIDIPDVGLNLRLDMISSMGNGYTFSLETVIFTCIVHAVYHTLGIPLDRPYGQNWGNFAVYGDDIIVLTEATRSVLRLLEICGFRINAAKTHVDGPFRESCGADFFRGANVRSFFIRKLRTKQDFAIAVNGLNVWSAKTGIFLPKTVQLLLKSLRGAYIVPYWENDDAGIKLPGHLARPSVDENGSYLYWCYQTRPCLIRVDEASLSDARQRLWVNPSGLLLAFLHGSIRSEAISVRHTDVVYDRVRRIAPTWDHWPHGLIPDRKQNATGVYLDGTGRWERWNTATIRNLFGS